MIYYFAMNKTQGCNCCTGCQYTERRYAECRYA